MWLCELNRTVRNGYSYTSIPGFLAYRSVTATVAGRVTRSQTKVDGDHKMRDVACGTFGYEEEEAHERRLAGYADVLRWEAKCLGYNYLGFDELQHHNSLMS